MVKTHLAINKDFRIGEPMLIQESRMSTFTAVLHKEDDTYVAECPEVGTVSQGKTVEVAVSNLKEATELHLEAPLFGSTSQRSL
jgi:predicted RNase H-like HicB family nuclease